MHATLGQSQVTLDFNMNQDEDPTLQQLHNSIRKMNKLSADHTLGAQIDTFTETLRSMTREKDDLVWVLERVRAIVISLWPNGSVEMYGSFVTGLSLPTSDFDLVVSSVTSDLKQSLYTLADMLTKEPWINENKLSRIAGAKVPVIKFEATLPDNHILLVDISFAERSLQPYELPPQDMPLVSSLLHILLLLLT